MLTCRRRNGWPTLAVAGAMPAFRIYVPYLDSRFWSLENCSFFNNSRICSIGQLCVINAEDRVHRITSIIVRYPVSLKCIRIASWSGGARCLPNAAVLVRFCLKIVLIIRKHPLHIVLIIRN
ncbi:hypothetical protein O6H91_Y502000 [Diphasiastrum complanatum]|nr:hypothetical protein O6H91_Y502000 [Diphasiastrum complanatum]